MPHHSLLHHQSSPPPLPPEPEVIESVLINDKDMQPTRFVLEEEIVQDEPLPMPTPRTLTFVQLQSPARNKEKESAPLHQSQQVRKPPEQY